MRLRALEHPRTQRETLPTWASTDGDEQEPGHGEPRRQSNMAGPDCHVDGIYAPGADRARQSATVSGLADGSMSTRDAPRPHSCSPKKHRSVSIGGFVVRRPCSWQIFDCRAQPG